MATNTLLMDLYQNALAGGVSPVSGIYCIVMDWNDFALTNSGGLYSMLAFLAANQSTLAFTMPQHAQRTRYYSTEVDLTAISMATTPRGRDYVMEFWEHVGPGNYSRSSDTLLEARKFKWSNGVSPGNVLDIEIETEQSQWVSNCSLAYDSASKTVTITAWLEKDGQQYFPAKNLDLVWRDRSGGTILHSTSAAPLFSGFFITSASPIDLTPDLSTAISISIQDQDGVAHISAISAITWD